MAYIPGVDTVILNGAREVLLAISGHSLAPLPVLVWRPPLLIHNIKEVLPGEPEVVVVDGLICGDLEQDGEWDVIVDF